MTKSQSQTELEGFEFLTNANVHSPWSDRPVRVFMNGASDQIIKEEYLRRGFKEVKIADAYDVNYRAVYVKK